MEMKSRLARACTVLIFGAIGLFGVSDPTDASEAAAKVERNYVMAPAAPVNQPSATAANDKSAGCVSCHTESDQKTMHNAPGVDLGCTDCHGGDASQFVPHNSASGGASGGENGQGLPKGKQSDDYIAVKELAHILPEYPGAWDYPHSANPERTYTLLNKESREFVRFVNPSDYRVVELACGACHQDQIEKSVRSLHATSAMFWGGATYNNGILPFKQYLFGESYTSDGEPAILKGPVLDAVLAAQLQDENGILPQLLPLPAWESTKPGDVFRVFERGGRNIINLFPETAIPNALGLVQRLEEPGRPDIRQSNRGSGTGARIAVPVINVTKTRLNDPYTWFMGTNDQPGDFRNSGCASCHVVYANDRDPRHSGRYAQHGHTGQTATVDPTIPQGESGHPIKHSFTNAIPTSQCMVCHMHQPNMFVNSYLGYTMWDYESDAPAMWPQEQAYPTSEEIHEVLERNPEGAAPRGKWADTDFLEAVSELNPELNDTQFADYHGHGWNFRAVFKRDRTGNLLDAQNRVVKNDDPDKFDKAVHMSSIHLDVGMHCVDCHFAQDNHGNGHIQGEVALAVEIDCKDCHGTAQELPNLFGSGPAAIDGGTDMLALRVPGGRPRFEWIDGELFQRSALDKNLEWKVSLLKNAVDPKHSEYNAKAARAKTMSKDTASQQWGPEVASDDLAHSYDDMECYTCHTSWTTSCGGCHLPIEANKKTERHHYEGGESRNFATYNPQVARDQMFLLGRRGPAKGGKIAPVRSTSALVLSSTNANREKIYIQQPPVASSGYSSQAFNPHFPHTVRLSETKNCSDCHLSEDNNNNAIMAQLLMFGTNFVNFVGYNAWVGGDGEVSGIQVTEWEEPQAVIGSYLQKYAYPDFFAQHEAGGGVLQHAYQHRAGVANCLQMRGEYLYVAEGKNGMRVYDIANVANKGFSQRIVTAPFSPLGQGTQVTSKNATCMALPTNQPVAPFKNESEFMRNVNLEQPFHPIYNYAVVTDAEEGLILIDVNTLQDGEARNNNLERAATWNPDGLLNGVRHITLGGSTAYLTLPTEVVIVSLEDPLRPELVSRIALDDPRATALQFRYLFVTTANGLETIDVTSAKSPKATGSVVAFDDARRVYVARTYAYVAAGAGGLGIVDATAPDQLKLQQIYSAEGKIADARDVIVATTNASLFAYVADGAGGLKVVQLTSPSLQPNFYGFSPEPNPELIASYPTKRPALALSKGLDRDRGVDETGGQIAVFGRRGSKPLSREDMNRMYLNKDGEPWFVKDTVGTGTAVNANPAASTSSTTTTSTSSAGAGAGGAR